MHKKDIFHFKQFSVAQDICAMKVGTDGVLLGAWTNGDKVKTILDIGTGTGVISFMLAQRFPLILIDAIDADEFAYQQCLINVQSYTRKLQNQGTIGAYHAALNEWLKIPGKKYDLMVCNPPYFSKGFIVGNKQRAKARAAEYLPQTDLVLAAKKLLPDAGRLCVIYPVQEAETFISLCSENSLFCRQKTFVYPKEHQPAKRILIEVAKAECEMQLDKIVIEKEGQHNYTEQYKELTKGFYLYF